MIGYIKIDIKKPLIFEQFPVTVNKTYESPYPIHDFVVVEKEIRRLFLTSYWPHPVDEEGNISYIIYKVKSPDDAEPCGDSYLSRKVEILEEITFDEYKKLLFQFGYWDRKMLDDFLEGPRKIKNLPNYADIYYNDIRLNCINSDYKKPLYKLKGFKEYKLSLKNIEDREAFRRNVHNAMFFKPKFQIVLSSVPKEVSEKLKEKCKYVNNNVISKMLKRFGL